MTWRDGGDEEESTSFFQLHMQMFSWEFEKKEEEIEGVKDRTLSQQCEWTIEMGKCCVKGWTFPRFIESPYFFGHLHFKSKGELFHPIENG